MRGFRFSSTPAVVTGTVSIILLVCQTGAQAVSQLQHPRQLATNDYTHLGCFADNENDRVFESALVDGAMTTEMCFNHCNERGASLMATQYGSECWCGFDAAADYGRHGDEALCTRPCSGNEDETCGGSYAFDAYLINYTYLGCFSDDSGDRLLDDVLVDGAMTTGMCFTHCSASGAPLMATQFGVECWCGFNTELDYERHGEGADCNNACPGNEDETCGGFNALDLYLLSTQVTDDDSEEGAPEGAIVPDIVSIIDVEGATPGGESWADSYSVGSRCYMASTFDHDIDIVEVETPRGTMTVLELFEILEAGPGKDGRPLYNDIQCGNGPPNDAADEVACPGLVEHGPEGCGQIGPLWDLSELE